MPEQSLARSTRQLLANAGEPQPEPASADDVLTVKWTVTTVHTYEAEFTREELASLVGVEVDDIPVTAAELDTLSNLREFDTVLWEREDARFLVEDDNKPTVIEWRVGSAENDKED